MTSIIEKRSSVHKELANQRERNNALQCQVSQMQALANIGSVTCMITHEINNLLTPVGNYAALALKNQQDKELIRKALEKVVRNCGRASKIMESMLAVANGESQEKRNTRLIDMVEEIFTCLCRDFRKDGITVEIRISEEVTVWAVPIQLQQVLMNLILNARDAMLPRGGILTIKARQTDEWVHIEIADTGRGIEAADMERIFEPFFSTRSDTRSAASSFGAGLGLAFCKRAIAEHNGSITVESEAMGGTTFKLSLPKSEKTAG